MREEVDMELDIDRLFDDLVQILKNSDFTEGKSWTTSLCSDFATLPFLSDDLDDMHYYKRRHYYYDKKIKVICLVKTYHRYNGKHYSAFQMLLRFNADSFRLDSYDISIDRLPTRREESIMPEPTYGDDGKEYVSDYDLMTVLHDTDRYLVMTGGKALFSSINIEDYYIDTNIQQYITKLADSNKISVQTNYDSLDEYFSTNSVYYDTLSIITADTKKELIKLFKIDNNSYEFVVDLTTDDRFKIRSIVDSYAKLTNCIKQTVDALRNDTQLSKYADDLEDYL